MVIIITAIFITATVSVVGAVTAMQRGDFWPWVWAMSGLYAIEIIYTIIIAILYFRSPIEREKRDFYKRRRERQQLRSSS